MPWIQLRIDTDSEHAELLSDLLMDEGSLSITFEDGQDTPIFEPKLGEVPLWKHTVVIALFDAGTDLTPTVEMLKNMPFLGADFSHKIEQVEDKDWVREWMDNFHPIQFGERLWICPSWREIPEPDAVNVMLDPGLAFGTGTHPTTALCLAWLDAQDITDKVVVDYGCGSGILGIAALLLGAKRVIGVDNDPQALEASRENTRRNNIPEERFEIYLPGEAPEVEADIMIANILAQPLISLSPTLASMTKQGGLLVLSGILEQQANDVSERYSEWFEMDKPEQKEEWIRLSGIKQ